MVEAEAAATEAEVLLVHSEAAHLLAHILPEVHQEEAHPEAATTAADHTAATTAAVTTVVVTTVAVTTAAVTTATDTTTMVIIMDIADLQPT